MSYRLFFVSFGALCALLAGCAADGTDATGEQAVGAQALRTTAIAPGVFKLYRTPRAQSNPSCDLHTQLALTADGGSHAALREVVGGVCEIFVDPAPREYRLHLDNTSCGSRIYKGQTRIDGKLRDITITDHRTRVCEDIVEAAIIVDETPALEGSVLGTLQLPRLFSSDSE